MKRLMSLVTILALVAPTAALAQAGVSVSRDRDYWMAYISKLPIGSTVRVRTIDGKRLTAVLAVVDDNGITLEQHTRVPEPPRQIAYEHIQQLEPKGNTSSVAKAVGIGTAVGAATFFGILLLLAAVYSD